MPNNSVSIRQQLIKIVEQAEHKSRATAATVATATAIHVTGTSFDIDVDVRIEVSPRHKMVFGKRMLGYQGYLDGNAARLTPIVKSGTGVTKSGSSLGLMYLDHRHTFIKWFAASVEVAANLLQQEQIKSERGTTPTP